jgi:MFS family permease
MGLYLLLSEHPSPTVTTEAQGTKTKPHGWGIEKKKAFTLLSGIGFVDTAVRASLITFLPFLLIGKGMPMEKTGLALTLLFIGGALGKFLCGVLAEKIGVIPSITITEAITGLGIFYLYTAPLSAVLPFLPFLGVALNGTSSVLYGTVADFVNPSRVPRAFGLFYTVIISASAVGPPVFGMISDTKGVPFTIVVIASFALVTLPLAFLLSMEMQKAVPRRPHL